MSPHFVFSFEKALRLWSFYHRTRNFHTLQLNSTPGILMRNKKVFQVGCVQPAFVVRRWGHDVTYCLVPCSFWGYDVTSCLVPEGSGLEGWICLQSGVWSHMGGWSQRGLVPEGEVWFRRGVWSRGGGGYGQGVWDYPLWTECQTHVKHYLPATSFGAVKTCSTMTVYTLISQSETQPAILIQETLFGYSIYCQLTLQPRVIPDPLFNSH